MRELRDDAEIFAFLSTDPYLHLYSIGDLDPFFRPHARYLGFPAEGALEAIQLRYEPGGGHCVVLAFGGREEFLREHLPALPARFYAHASPQLLPSLAGKNVRSHGRFLKMRLEGRPAEPAGRELRHLALSDLPALLAFYEHAYPANWFDPRMLETGQYAGGFENGALVAVAGIHVYSPRFRCAALGNIAVAPAARGRGWARDVTAFLCARMTLVDHIGLNVKADNAAAIRAYEAIGFRRHAEYEELSVG